MTLARFFFLLTIGGLAAMLGGCGDSDTRGTTDGSVISVDGGGSGSVDSGPPFDAGPFYDAGPRPDAGPGGRDAGGGGGSDAGGGGGGRCTNECLAMPGAVCCTSCGCEGAVRCMPSCGSGQRWDCELTCCFDIERSMCVGGAS